MIRLIFLGILPIILASINFNDYFFIRVYNSENLIDSFWVLCLFFYIVNFIIYLIIQLFKSTKVNEGQQTVKIIAFSFFSLSLFCIVIAIVNEISQIDDSRLSVQSIRLNTKDLAIYTDEAIKFRNPNLAEKEAEIIAENINIIDYMPLFLDYRAKKNAEFEKLKKEQLAAEEKQQKLKKEEDKKLLNNFLSKKCTLKDEKC